MKHYSQLLRLLLVALSICAFSAVIFAQEVTGSLNGTVKDATGGVVSGATVTISDSEKKVVLRTTTTNNDGQYSAPNIPSGVYDVTVEAPNFKKHIETGLKLNVSDKRTTLSSIKGFQQDYKLKVSGTVDSQTKDKIRELHGS